MVMAKKILIMEDEDTLANMYKLKFEKSGYQVILADNGEAGLVLVKEEKPDLVLLDIIMPKIDGFVVLERMKQDQEIKNIPVFMLTNLGQAEDIEKGKDLGANGYYVKANLTPGELVIKINQFFKI
ncbi:MAG: response regulator [Parcubacteria group bacterium CG1_02_37_51]|nr:MAG: response regulator [Parcubacteria group bacterium CG1_02_37_51]